MRGSNVELQHVHKMLTKCFQNMRMQIFRSNVPTGERFQQIPQKCSVSSPNCCKVPRGRFFPPHLCVGSCLCFCIPSAPPPVLLRLLRHLLLHITLSHTTLSHTAHTHKHTTLSHTTLSHTIDLRSAWQAWHLWHWAGSGDIHHRFTWQAWHLATSTFVLRGRCGAWGTGLGLVARLGAGSRPWRRSTLRGRRGSVALGDIHLRFTWQAWHLATSTFHLRGRRGDWRHQLCFCAAGVALVALGWVWWCAWAPLVRGTLRGRRGMPLLVLCMCSCSKQTDVMSSVTSLSGGAGWCGCACLEPTLSFQPGMTARAMG